MYQVVRNDQIAPEVHRLVVKAPRVAVARKPGQFVIVRADDQSERIPLTIADADPEADTITLIVQAVGTSTRRIIATEAGGALRDVAGPLGRATEIERFGKVVKRLEHFA